jgi:hypothetical protein
LLKVEKKTSGRRPGTERSVRQATRGLDPASDPPGRCTSGSAKRIVDK